MRGKKLSLVGAVLVLSGLLVWSVRAVRGVAGAAAEAINSGGPRRDNR